MGNPWRPGCQGSPMNQVGHVVLQDVFRMSMAGNKRCWLLGCWFGTRASQRQSPFPVEAASGHRVIEALAAPGQYTPSNRAGLATPVLHGWQGRAKPGRDGRLNAYEDRGE